MKRVKELCQAQGVLDRLLVIRALTVEALLEAADYIEEQLDSTRIPLVVVDNVCVPFRVFKSDNVAERTMYIRLFGLRWRRLGHRTTLFFTNHLTTRFIPTATGESRSVLVPALGESWSIMCDLQILLEQDHASNRNLLIMHSDFEEYPRKQLFFEIQNDGIIFVANKPR